MFLLSIVILSCKMTSFICLIMAARSYHWFRIDDYSVNKYVIRNLCPSYGAFCDMDDQVPLPRITVIIPCVLTTVGFALEVINMTLLYVQYARSMVNFCLEQTSIALSCALTIHCIWVTAVHIRISLEMPMIHLDWAFFVFALATVLMPIDCVCSVARIINNCQYEKVTQVQQNVPAHNYRHRSIVGQDI